MKRRLRRLRGGGNGPRIGLGISSDSIRAVGVRDRAITWALEAPIDASAPLAQQIEELLSKAPGTTSRWRRPKVLAVVGPALAQTKRLYGLPPAIDVQTAASLVQEGAGRFFITGTEPLLTSQVWAPESGEVWAAAFDQRTVGAIESACERASFALVAVLPTVVVLPDAILGSAIIWYDGETSVEIAVTSNVFRAVRRRVHTHGCAHESRQAEGDSTGVVAELAGLGENATRFAGAYGAAVTQHRKHSLAAPIGHDARTDAAISGKRAALAVAFCTCAIAAAALSPGLAAERAGRNARAELATLSAARAELHDLEKNLGLVSGALAEVATAESRRQSRLAFIGQLATTLPEGSAIVALRIDSVGGTVVALTPRAAVLVNRLDTLPSVIGPQIVGPVTREIVSGRDLERVTVRFTTTSGDEP